MHMIVHACYDIVSCKCGHVFLVVCIHIIVVCAYHNSV